MTDHKILTSLGWIYLAGSCLYTSASFCRWAANELTAPLHPPAQTQPALSPLPEIFDDFPPAPPEGEQEEVEWDPLPQEESASAERFGPDGLPQHSGDMVIMSAALFDPGDRFTAPVGEVPAALANAIVKHYSDPTDQAIVAAVAYRESTYRPELVGDGGYSYGTFQIHKRWHPDIVAAMGNDWDAYDVNLSAFRQVISKQAAWRKGRDSWRGILSYYHDGNAWNKPKAQRYVADILAKAKALQPHFT